MTISEIIVDACNRNGVPDFANKVKYKFSKKMTVCGGKARLTQNLVVFGVAVWEAATPEQRTNIVYHEACHLIAYHKFGRMSLADGPHGWRWKSCMIKCGQNPARTHSVKVERRPMKEVECDCGIRYMGLTRYHRLISGEQTYYCRNCNKNVVPVT